MLQEGILFKSLVEDPVNTLTQVTLRRLISYKADINFYDANTRHTALSYAISHGIPLASVKLLLDMNASPNTSLYPTDQTSLTKRRVTPISHAVYAQRFDVIEPLIKASGSADCSVLIPWDVREKLTPQSPQDAKADSSPYGCKDSIVFHFIEYEYPLHYLSALKYDRVAINKLYPSRQGQYFTPLFLAAKVGYRGAVRLLLDAGAPVLGDKTAGVSVRENEALLSSLDAAVDSGVWPSPRPRLSNDNCHGWTVLMAAVAGDRAATMEVQDTYSGDADAGAGDEDEDKNEDINGTGDANMVATITNSSTGAATGMRTAAALVGGHSGAAAQACVYQVLLQVLLELGLRIEDVVNK